MNLLLVGGTGQVGRELQRSLRPLGTLVVTSRTGFNFDGTPCETLDIEDLAAIGPMVERIAPDAVVNAAAYTAVDRAEDEPELAFRVNAEAPGVLARACAARSVPLVHYSTDYVFDGAGTRPYRETDPTAPLGVYGASKLAGEEAVRASGAAHLILRTAWVYATHGKNFLLTMLRLAAERDELRVVADQIGCPTPAWLIADVTARLLAQSRCFRGRLHVTSLGQTSWHGFAQAIVDEAARAGLLSRAPQVVPIATADYPTRAQRPAYSVLDCTVLREQAGIDLPAWDAALATTMRSLAASRSPGAPGRLS